MAHLYSDGRSQLERGNLAVTLNDAEQGLKSSANDPVWNWKFRELKAEVLLWKYKPDEALKLLEGEPPEGLKTGEFAVRIKNAQGEALLLKRRHMEAQQRLQEAEALSLKTAPDLQCETLLYEGNLAFNQRQFPLAEERYRQSLQLAQQDKRTYIESSALSSLGLISTTVGRLDEGIEWSSKARSFAHEHGYRLNESVSLLNLGWSYRCLGDIDKAISNFSEDEEVVESAGLEQSKEDLFGNLGAVYDDLGDYAQARASYLVALDIAQKTFDPADKYFLVNALTQVATVAFEQGKLDEAEKYLRQAFDLNQNHPFAVLTSARIAAARHNLPAAKASLQKLMQSEDTERLLRWDAELELANILALEHKNGPAESEFEALTTSVEKARSSLRVDENRLAFSSHAGRYYDEYVSFLVATGQKRKAFQVAEFSRARTLEEGVGIEAPKRPSDISIERIQAFLRQNKKDAILAYWLAAGQSFVWVISPLRFDLFPIASQHEIEQRVDEYNKLLQKIEKAEELEDTGQSLYQTLLGRVEKLIPANARLVIIPDGGLSKLNFETLRAPRPSPHYWIDDVETEITSSTTLLISSKKREMVPKKLLLIGNPILASSDYPPLTHAAEESQRVEAHFPQGEETVTLGKDAVPSSYQASHPERFETIHFVTHGTAHELSPLESAIILSPESENVFKLYARDIVNIPIKADLVTISACYGLGKRAYSGEGLVGLAWAFLRAGAHQVVAGLWDVDDLASVDLMDDFYTGLKHQSTAAALRAAKLKMVRSTGIYRLPYYWGSLQLYMGS